MKTAFGAALGINPGMTIETFQTLYLGGRLKNFNVDLEGREKQGCRTRKPALLPEMRQPVPGD